MRILVTGGSGRIGKHIIKTLQENNHEIINFDVIPSKDLSCTFIKGDLKDCNSVKSATKEVDVVVHLAAYPTENSIIDHGGYWEGWDVNITGSFNVLQAAVENGVKKVIYASSICSTGIITWAGSTHALEYLPVDEKHPFKAQNLYGIGKAMIENLCYMYSEKFELSTVCMRMATVWFEKNKKYNEWCDDPALMINKSALMRDLSWQFVGVDDAAQAFKLAVEKPLKGYVAYNVGGSETPTYWDSLKLAETFFPDIPIHNPHLFLYNPKKPLWDISKIQRDLNYRPNCSWKDYLVKTT